MVGRKVGSFAQIGFQIIKFIDFLAVILDRIPVEVRIGLKILPLAFAHSGFVKIKVLATRFTFSEDQVGLVHAINAPILGHFESAEVGKGWHKIDGGKDRIIHAAHRHLARPTHNTGKTITGLVRRTLAVTQGARFTPEDGVFGMALLALGIFVLIPRAVVTGVDHQCVIR